MGYFNNLLPFGSFFLLNIYTKWTHLLNKLHLNLKFKEMKVTVFHASIFLHLLNDKSLPSPSK